MVEIYIGSAPENKIKADVDVSFEMIRQVMDIFDISIRVVDHSKTLKMPMTAKNKMIFEGLGFVDSQFPYKRTYADVYVNGILLMKDAYVQVKDYEGHYYSVGLISESKEIWKLVENATLGDLDLEDTEHTKTAELIKSQWETGLNPAAKFLYFLGDYGGKIPADNKVFGDFLVPSYRLSYLIDKINEKYSVNVVLPSFLQNTFITFSDANQIEETNDKIIYERNYSPPVDRRNIGPYVIEEDGDYIIKLNARGLRKANLVVFSLTVKLGSYTHTFPQNSPPENWTSPVIRLKKGDSISFSAPHDEWWLYGLVQIVRKAIDVSGNKAFENYKIHDFLKEIIYQSAGIPIKNGNTYDFVTLAEIISNDVLDWSDYFDSADKTTFVIGKYAQNNWFRYKYAESEDFNKDGLFLISNVNLDTNKDIIKSTLYNTPVNSIPFTLGGTLLASQQYHLWKRTVEQKDGVFTERYQGQSGRMFLLSGVSYTTASNFNIEVGTGSVTTNKVILANNEDYNFQTVINKRYREFSKILQNAKVVDTVFKIPLIEFANFDFKRRIYVKQLQGYFIVNRIVFQSGELLKIELIEANLNPEIITPEEPTEPTNLTMVFESNMASQKTRYAASGSVVSENVFIIGDTTGVTLDLLIDGVPWPSTVTDNILTFSIEAAINLSYGTHELLITGVENAIYYTILNPKPPIDEYEPIEEPY